MDGRGRLTMTGKTYIVLSPVQSDRLYRVGEPIEMAPGEAAGLAAAGVLADPDNPDGAPAAALSGVFEQALDTIRRAPPAEIRAFFARMADDPGIAARIDAAQRLPPPGGADGTDRKALIVGAIRGLDPDEETLWTLSGPPTVAAVEAALGFGISAAERDEAWAAVQAARSTAFAHEEG